MMWQIGKPRILFAPEGAGAGGAGDGGAAAAAAAAAAGGSGGAAAAPSAKWFDGIADDVRGWAESKAWLGDDPKAAFAKAVTAHREAQKFIGAPPEEIIRMPKANAAESDIKAFWQRVGVPAEAKDYDLSAVKFSDGTELDQGFSDTIRGLLHAARVPADRAADIVKGLVKIEESEDAAEKATTTRTVQEQQQALERNWGANKAANLVVAQAALEKLGQAAGLTAEQTKTGWDALSKVGGIGASFAMEMLRIAGSRMGEDRFVGGGQGGQQQSLSSAAAAAEIDALKNDAAFRQRLLNGDRESRRKWDDLHAVRDAALRQARVA